MVTMIAISMATYYVASYLLVHVLDRRHTSRRDKEAQLSVTFLRARRVER